MLQKYSPSVCLILLQLIFGIGCQTGSKQGFKAIEGQDIEIFMSPLRGRTDRQRMHSQSIQKNYENTQLVRNKERSVDFEVESKDVSMNHLIQLQVTTIKKDGLVNLNDMALPELDETLRYVYTPKGDVLKVEGKPEGSVWYIPPFPIPKNKVQVGDSWVMKSTWRSEGNNIPFTMEMVAILKNLYRCFENQSCVDLEISGGINLPPGLDKNLRLNSQVQGRLVFNINESAVLWSEFKSHERFITGEQMTESYTCTTSYQYYPESTSLKMPGKLTCDPMSLTVSPVL